MIINAYGLPGTGKSTLLHDLVRAHAPTHRIFANDHEDGWDSSAIHWRGKPPAKLVVVEGEGMFQELAETPADDWDTTGVWVFRNIDPSRVADLAVAKGEVVFVDDELDALARQEGWTKSALRRIVHEGRHLPNEDGTPTRLHIIGACRRPQNLHIDVATMVDEVYCFRLQGHRTLQRLVDDSIITPDEWEEVRSLPNFHFIHWPSGKRLSIPPIGHSSPQPHGQLPVKND